MKRHKALILLSHDHHRGLLLAQLLKKNAPPYKGLPKEISGKIEYAVNAFNSELIKHFEDEEKILFPMLKQKSDETLKLINDLIAEHKVLKANILSFKESGNAEELMDETGKLLEQHIRKEERILFQNAQNELSQKELNSIEITINESRGKNN